MLAEPDFSREISFCEVSSCLSIFRVPPSPPNSSSPLSFVPDAETVPSNQTFPLNCFPSATKLSSNSISINPSGEIVYVPTATPFL